MAILYPLINGHRFDYSSLEIDILGIVAGCKEVSYSQSLTPGLLHGTRAQPIGRTRGKYEAEASITLYAQEYNDLIAKLTSAGGSFDMGYLEVSFNMMITYSERSSPVMQDRIMGCRIMKEESSGSEGEEPLIVKADLSVMAIIKNQKSPIGIKNFLQP